MLQRSKLYTRREPTKDAKLFLIFCEGGTTEPNYFGYFQNISHNINLIVAEHGKSKNNPIGLYETACEVLLKTDENPNPKYDVAAIDEIWFVIDTDKWNEQGDKINQLKGKLQEHPTWKIAQSNPCFEVWLHYHHFEERPDFENINKCKSWKAYLNDKISGFNTKSHPILIEDAIQRAKNIHDETDSQPSICCTEVFKLAELFFPFVKEEIDKEREKL